MRAVPILLEDRGQDLSYWGCTTNGEFSVSSVYEIVAGLRDHTGGILENMKWIWHLRCPERIRVFIWILYLNKLNVNEVRARKGMTAYVFCDRCPGRVESIEHVFCECPDAMNIWGRLKANTSVTSFLTRPFKEWLKLNCLTMTVGVDGIQWNIIFISSLWSLWKSRNIRIYEGKCMRSEDIFQYAYKLSMDIKAAWSLNVRRAVKSP